MLLENFRNTFKDKYEIQNITHENLQDAFEIMCANTYYFSKIQRHPVSMSECEKNLYALPPHTVLSQKHYIGLYTEGKCVALIAYIESYPYSSCVYLGLLMLHPRYHKLGIGKELVDAFIKSAEINGFSEIKLACYQENLIGYNFWRKMGFITEKESVRETDGLPFKLLEMHTLCS